MEGFTRTIEYELLTRAAKRQSVLDLRERRAFETETKIQRPFEIEREWAGFYGKSMLEKGWKVRC